MRYASLQTMTATHVLRRRNFGALGCKIVLFYQDDAGNRVWRNSVQLAVGFTEFYNMPLLQHGMCKEPVNMPKATLPSLSQLLARRNNKSCAQTL